MHRPPIERIRRMLEAGGKERSNVRMGGGEIGMLPVDVAEWDGQLVVTGDLPGFDREDIDIRVSDHTLHISAEREAEEEGEEYIQRERLRTDVSRSIKLPEDIDFAAASASFENGVLTVTLPKEHHEEGHEIPLS